MAWKITKKDIPYFALGAKFLGSGGGGDPFTLSSLVQSIMSDSQEIEILPFTEIAPNDHIVCLSSIGSSVICDEKMSTGEEGLLALDCYEEARAAKATALIALNVGGANAMVPFIVAAQRNLPIVDGDGTGRTFPEIHMSSFHLMGVQAGPLAMSNQHRETRLFDEVDNHRIVREARQQVHPMGGIVYIAGFGMDGRQMSTVILPSTLQLIYELGRIFLETPSRAASLQQMHAVLTNSIFGSPRCLIQGKIRGISRRFQNGLIEGRFEILGTERWDGQVVEVGFGNEYNYARKNDRYLCLTPDLLLVLDEETFQPCMTEDLQEGRLVTMYGIPAPNVLRTSDMLEFVGPRAFGIDAEFIPVEFASEAGV
ncbi:DUF917 domain-containing protein [Brevibacillus fluminis]|uniref:DUF917 domain-containing protein n=1 Tax=Brevibacillus fluminis TaxID=511487 RepID=A0A3M8DZD1_9BACL|nr:DUF917 domain-containing protein [Brevibacillus fluminis]RNB92601.1 DUF917 domain-containing protein [Brevibacillus fluminis]